MEQKKIPDFNLSSEGLGKFPEEFKNKPFEDWEDAKKGIEEAIKIAIDNRTYNISDGINGALRRALGPFYNDIPKISVDIFLEKAKVFEKEFLERCPGLKEKMDKDREIRKGNKTKKNSFDTEIHRRGSYHHEKRQGLKEDD